jgi:UDPglucose 6-dehydrogenase
MKKNAAIIGGGVLGQATAKSLGINNIYDEISDRSNIEKSQLRDFRYIFICVPTPSDDNGCDISIVEKSISDSKNGQVLVIRSTVIPGTAENLMKKYKCDIISNPEFLTEKTSIEDAINPDIIVIGGRTGSITNDFYKLFYAEDFKDSHIIRTDNKTAETIKYSINNFYAVKVIFANYLYRVCRKNNVDYDVVKDAMYKRKWIGKNHLTVPFNGKMGVNGKCLPKDLVAFAEYTGDDFFRNMVKSMKDIKDWKL